MHLAGEKKKKIKEKKLSGDFQPVAFGYLEVFEIFVPASWKVAKERQCLVNRVNLTLWARHRHSSTHLDLIMDAYDGYTFEFSC